MPIIIYLVNEINMSINDYFGFNADFDQYTCMIVSTVARAKTLIDENRSFFLEIKQ